MTEEVFNDAVQSCVEIMNADQRTGFMALLTLKKRLTDSNDWELVEKLKLQYFYLAGERAIAFCSAIYSWEDS